MNTNTGEIIRLAPDEPAPEGFVEVSEKVARAVSEGFKSLERKARRKRERQNRRRGRR